jgi:alkylation response protein AidB-like acyl-CoA dehydrogenase
MMTTFVAASPDVSKHRADRLITWLGEYAKERINSQLIDERRCVPPYIYLDLGNQGLWGMQIPEQYGGLALTYRDFMRVMEQLAAIDLTIATAVSLNNTLGTRPIVGYATPEVREELLPILARGREMAAFCMTEPGAGADIGTIGTLATADHQGGWQLRGVKRWNGSAWAGIISVFARLVDPSTHQSGLTGFIVRQGAPGLRIGQESLTMGLRGIVQNALYFEDVPVSSRDLLGELSRGTEPADDAVMVARLGVGAITIGGMKRCAQLMLRYAERRAVATGRLLHTPITLAKLSDLTALIAALESLMAVITDTLDSGYAIPREAAVVAKIAGSEFLWQAADDLMQMLGGRGYMDNNLASQLLRDARVLRIGEGPNESLKIFLGKSVLHTDKLEQFLRDRLHAPQLADQLKDAADRINSRCLTAGVPFDDRSFGMVWAYSLTGDVAINALLLAAIQSKISIQRQPVVEWARCRFEQTLREAISGVPTEALIADSESIRTMINDYSAAINDIEQTLAGADHELDEFLQRHPNHNANFVKTVDQPLSHPVNNDSKPVEYEQNSSETNRNGSENLNGNSHNGINFDHENDTLICIKSNREIISGHCNSHSQNNSVISLSIHESSPESKVSGSTTVVEADCHHSIAIRIAKEIETVRLLADKIAITVQRKP